MTDRVYGELYAYDGVAWLTIDGGGTPTVVRLARAHGRALQAALTAWLAAGEGEGGA